MRYPTYICITVLACQYDFYALSYWNVDTSYLRYPTSMHYRVDLSIWFLWIIVLKCRYELYALPNFDALPCWLVDMSYIHSPSYMHYRIEISRRVTCVAQRIRTTVWTCQYEITCVTQPLCITALTCQYLSRTTCASHTILCSTMTICDKLNALPHWLFNTCHEQLVQSHNLVEHNDYMWPVICITALNFQYSSRTTCTVTQSCIAQWLYLTSDLMTEIHDIALLALTSQKLCCQHLSAPVTCHWQLISSLWNIRLYDMLYQFPKCVVCVAGSD